MLTSPGGGGNMNFTGSTATTTRRVAQADPMPRNPNQFRPPPGKYLELSQSHFTF